MTSHSEGRPGRLLRKFSQLLEHKLYIYVFSYIVLHQYSDILCIQTINRMIHRVIVLVLVESILARWQYFQISKLANSLTAPVRWNLSL